MSGETHLSKQATAFMYDLEKLLRKHSMGKESNTHSRILALYLTHCLVAWDAAIDHREDWKDEPDITRIG